MASNATKIKKKVKQDNQSEFSYDYRVQIELTDQFNNVFFIDTLFVGLFFGFMISGSVLPWPATKSPNHYFSNNSTTEDLTCIHIFCFFPVEWSI